MKYCAFLRGINVNGISIKMIELEDVFKKLGFPDAKTILATGNVVFSSDKEQDELKKILENKMSSHFGYDAFLFIKNEHEIVDIMAGNPFVSSADFHAYVFICDRGFEDKLYAEFVECAKTEGEDAKIENGYFYWQISKGNTLNSAFGKILGKKDFKPFFTSRNINTLHKISAKFKTK